MTTPSDPPAGCPVCGAESVYVLSLARFVHCDGAANDTCWAYLRRRQPLLYRPTIVSDAEGTPIVVDADTGDPVPRVLNASNAPPPDHRDARRFYEKLVDDVCSVELADVGLTGFELAETVDSDGFRQLWILDRAQLGKPGTDHGNQRPHHEGWGMLPAGVREAVRAAPLRCGRRRRDGGACRAIVTHRGDACSWHRIEQEADR
ncbi:hypothetical protein [Gordonia sp. NPDC003585]|uniref:hypothetical protein n=1 Tax=Gordonia sp. NPDC003585 TaxID=3154275 RepID=UPI0033B670ED